MRRRNKYKQREKVKKPFPKSKRIGRKKITIEEQHCWIAEQACTIGATVDDLSRMFGVTIPTISRWMRDDYKFFIAVKNGRDRFDTEKVESSLLKRAQGYEKDITEERVTKDGKIRCIKTLHFAPDVGAAIFWLCNRNPQRWKQIAQARFQQMNLYTGTGSEQQKKTQEGGEALDANGIREILAALKESGAIEIEQSLPVTGTDKGDDAKAN